MTVSQVITSRTETTINVSWASDSVIDYLYYSINNGVSFIGIAIGHAQSGSYTINNLAANTTYQVITRLKSGQEIADSTAVSVKTYNYPSAEIMPNFNVGNKLTVTLNNPLWRDVTVTLIGADDSEIKSLTTNSNSVSGWNDETSIDRLLASLTSANSGTYKVKVAYSGQSNTATGGTYYIDYEYAPTISTIAYRDTNVNVTSITQDNTKIVRNQSTILLSVGGIETLQGATISSAKATINGNDYTMAISAATASVSNIVIDSAIDVTATVTITDSRGNKGTKTITITMYDWVAPSAIISANRQSNYYSNTDVNVNADFSSVNNLNSVTIKARYKKTTASAYSADVTLMDEVTTTLSLDNQYEWNLQIDVTDLFATTQYNLIIPKGLPLVFFDKGKSSVGINCLPVDNASLEVNGVNIVDSLFYKNGEVVTITNLVVAGFCTSSNKKLNFSVQLPKSFTRTPTITALKLNVRHSGGGYTLTNDYVAGGHNVLTDSTLTVSVTTTINAITVNIEKTSAYNGTNNTPQAVTIETMTVTF